MLSSLPTRHVVQQTTVTHTTTVYSSPPSTQATSPSSSNSTRKGGLPIGNLLQQQKALAAKRPSPQGGSEGDERGGKAAKVIEAGEAWGGGALVGLPKGGERGRGGGNALGGSSTMLDALRGSGLMRPPTGRQQTQHSPLRYPVQLAAPLPLTSALVPIQTSPRASTSGFAGAISPASSSSARRPPFDTPQPTFSTGPSISFSSPRSYTPPASTYYEGYPQDKQERYSPVLGGDHVYGGDQQQQPQRAYVEDEEEAEYKEDDEGGYNERGEENMRSEIMLDDGGDEGYYSEEQADEGDVQMVSTSGAKIEELEAAAETREEKDRGRQMKSSQRIDDELRYDPGVCLFLPFP
jgi:hypothetical protein